MTNLAMLYVCIVSVMIFGCSNCGEPFEPPTKREIALYSSVLMRDGSERSKAEVNMRVVEIVDFCAEFYSGRSNGWVDALSGVRVKGD